MNEVNLKSVDLNLLVALDVLLEERHVTNSAMRLGLSQPAMSRTLNRLRKLFNDPLIVRAQKGYDTTPRAEELTATLKTALAQVRAIFSEAEFDPATSADKFRISTLDYSELVIFPQLMGRIRAAAPGVKLEVLQRSILSVEEIIDGAADISIGLKPSKFPKHCVAETLFEDDYVCVMHKDHKIAGQKLTMENYLKYPHSIIHTGLTPGSYLDDALAKLGYERNIVKRSPHFVASLFAIGQSDMLQTVPRRLATPMIKAAGMIAHNLPFKIKPMVLSQMWHSRNTNNPTHKWMRGQIRASARDLMEQT